jgi:hypothetical protein
VDVKKKRERKEKKQKYSKRECVCLYLFYFFYVYFYDEIAKIKEEFNILIGSRSRIINLYVSCISNIR